MVAGTLGCRIRWSWQLYVVEGQLEGVMEGALSSSGFVPNIVQAEFRIASQGNRDKHNPMPPPLHALAHSSAEMGIVARFHPLILNPEVTRFRSLSHLNFGAAFLSLCGYRIRGLFQMYKIQSKC